VNLQLIPWWAVGLAAILLVALLEPPFSSLLHAIAHGVRRMAGPVGDRQSPGLADLFGAVGGWLAARTRDLAAQHDVNVARFVGGVLLTVLFVFAVAMETALMKVTLELILPLRDDGVNLFGMRFDPALATALAVVFFEAGAMLILLEVLGLTNMFSWDEHWSPRTRRVVAILFAFVVVALIGVQGALAWLRLSHPDAAPSSMPWGLSPAADVLPAALDGSGRLGRWVGVALSSLIPIFAAAGALGMHILMISTAAMLIALVSGLIWIGAHGFAMVSMVAQWLAELASAFMKLLAWPGRLVIQAIDGVLAAISARFKRRVS